MRGSFESIQTLILETVTRRCQLHSCAVVAHDLTRLYLAKGPGKESIPPGHEGAFLFETLCPVIMFDADVHSQAVVKVAIQCIITFPGF